MARLIKKNKLEFFVDNTKPHIDYFWDRYDEGWEKRTFEIFDRYIDKEHSYIDIGAWIGPTCLYGAQLSKQCYAIEPDLTAYSLLVGSVNLNSFKEKIKMFDIAIWNKNCELELFCNDKRFGNSMTSALMTDKKKHPYAAESVASFKCKAITLSDFVKINNICDCNFIKFDIEGGEALIIPHEKEYILKNKPTMHISIHLYWFPDLENNCKNLIDILKNYKYIYDNNKNLIDLNWLFYNHLRQESYFNYLSYDIVVADVCWD